MFTDRPEKRAGMRYLCIIAVIAALLGLACFRSKDNPAKEHPENRPVADTLSLRHSVDTLTSLLAEGDRSGIRSMMTESALATYGDILDSLSDAELETIAEAFDHKKAGTCSPTIAEYSITIDGLTYTIALAPGESEGSWNIVRF